MTADKAIKQNNSSYSRMTADKVVKQKTNSKKSSFFNISCLLWRLFHPKCLIYYIQHGNYFNRSV